jgi:threonine/homoserine/homoserine lactone efflux protein
MIATRLLQGLGLGFSSAVSPGPYQAFLLAQSGQRSLWRCLPLALVPLFSDGPIIALVLLVLTHTPAWFTSVLHLAGGFFLLYLARGAWQVYRHAARVTARQAPSDGGLWKGVLVNVLNPAPYLFWGTVGGPILVQSWVQSPLLALGFMLAFYLTLIIINGGFIVLFSLAHRLDARLTAALNIISALALLLLGLYQLWEGGRTLMGM